VTVGGGGSFAGKDVGNSIAVTSALSLGGTNASDYSLTQPGGLAANITPFVLTISATGVNRAYNGTTLATVALSDNGFIGDNITPTYGSASFASKNVSNGIAISVTGITLGGTDASNYIGNYTASTTANITPALLTVSGLSGTNRTYNGTTMDALSGTAVLNGLVAGETLTLGNKADGTLASANAGSEAVTTAITIGNGTGSASNYNLTQPTLGNVTIAKALLTVSTSKVTKTYDGTLTAAGTPIVTSGTLFSNASNGGTADVLTGGSFAFTNANAGTGNKTVTVSGIGVNDGNGGGNYTISQANNTTSTINPAPLTVSGLSGTNRVYNGTTLDALSGTAVLSGLLSGQTLILGNTANGTLASANAGSEAVTTAITIANGTGGLTSNYTLTQPTLANVTIAQAPLTVTGLSGTNRIYNGSTVDVLSGTAVLHGLVGSQTLTLVKNGTLASANAGSEALTGAITLANGTGVASNYSLTQPTLANVTIAQAPLTVTGLSGTNRTYNGTTVDALSGTAVLHGLVTGQTLTLGNTADGTLASANAGSEAVTTSLTLANGTGLASNYSLTQPTLTNVSISKATLTTIDATAQSKVFNGTTAAMITGEILVGVFGTDVVTVSGSGTFATASVGNNIAVTADLVLAGAKALDYVLTQPSGLTANITP